MTPNNPPAPARPISPRCNAAGLPLVALAFLALSACTATSTPNRGQTGWRLDPSHDAPGELGADTLRSEDLLMATERMAMDIATRWDINDPDNPPTVVVGTIENQTSMPSRNWNVFLARLRTLLTGSDTTTRHGLRFVQDRAAMQRYLQREFGTTSGYQSSAEYILTCVISDMPNRGSNYFLLDYQIVQLVPDATTGPDSGAGVIVWEKAYEVKYQW